MTEKIVVKHLNKIFGPTPDAALGLSQQGHDKESVFQQTGATVGVSDANFSIHAGEIFVIMGLSGSGKSTMVRMLNRLIEPTSGEIYIDGINIMQMNHNELINLRRRDIAMVFQSFALLPHLTVLENAAFGLEVAKVDKAERTERAMAALEQVGLSGNASSYPDELSGGMQQRVGLARALATNPTILLMDEAFSALDPLIRREMQEELLRLQEQHERTVVFISHDLDEAMRIGDRIAIMEGGQVLQVGTPREILENPASDYIRNFFRDVDLAQVYTAGDVADTDSPVFNLDDKPAADVVLTTLDSQALTYAYLVDGQQHFVGVVSHESLQTIGKQPVETACLAEPRTLRSGTHLGEVFGPVATTPYPLPVLARHNRFVGVLSRTRLLETLEKSGS
jgi:glycine betaine/proline transport system ATP-binding protein